MDETLAFLEAWLPTALVELIIQFWFDRPQEAKRLMEQTRSIPALAYLWETVLKEWSPTKVFSLQEMLAELISKSQQLIWFERQAKVKEQRVQLLSRLRSCLFLLFAQSHQRVTPRQLQDFIYARDKELWDDLWEWHLDHARWTESDENIYLTACHEFFE